MRLDRILVEGYRSIRHLDVRLRAINVLIGANGAGKSNFVSMFAFLNNVARRNLARHIREAGGANSILHHGNKTTSRIRVELKFPQEGYEAIWAPTADDNLYFVEEICRVKPPGQRDTIEKALGQGGHQESRLPEPPKAGPHKVGQRVWHALQTWRLYHFHDTSDAAPVKKTGEITDNIFLRSDAANLAAFLYRLSNESPRHYEAIRESVRTVAPFFDDFVLRPVPENEKTIRLEWRERGSDYPFGAHHLSDGTLRFVCLATLLLQPYPPDTLVVDDPELGLHSYAIRVLASLLKSAATRVQVMVSTQSATLIDEFAPEDLLVVKSKDNETHIVRLETGKLARWLKDYSLGDLWEKNVIGGRPSR